MNKPTIKSGRLTFGSDCTFGENVTIDVADEVVLGDRCVIGDNTLLSGRRITISDDFFGYSHWNKRLEVGLGKRDEEDAVLTVGARNTWHDNRIDLTKRVTIGDDVGLSPEAVIYCHHYWMSSLDGFPCRHAPVEIGNRVIVGFRATVLAGAVIPDGSVIGAGCVVAKRLEFEDTVYLGNPIKAVLPMKRLSNLNRQMLVAGYVAEWTQTLSYRNRPLTNGVAVDYPFLRVHGCNLDVEKLTVTGNEDPYSDDLREFLFKRGIRCFSKRPFKRLERLT